LIRDPLGPFRKVGKWTYFLRDIGRAVPDFRTYGSETIRQMRNIGVDSLPLAAIVAAFIGAVTAFQTRYQLFGGVQLSVVGLISRQSIILELGPLLTGLVLTGRVGARITAEIGTMRVTEQIDALETLTFDPVNFLVVPRVWASTIMFPIVVASAMLVGVVSGWLASLTLLDMTTPQFLMGVRLFFSEFDVRYGVVKAASFGGAVALIGCRAGLTAEGGAQGVGRSATRAVVTGAVMILVLDAFWAIVWLSGRTIR